MYNAREMDSLLFSSNFRYAATAADFTKTKAIMHPELNNYRSNDFEGTEVSKGSKQEELQRCNLTGYQPGPSATSLLGSLCADTVSGHGGADYLDRKASNTEEMGFNAGFGCGDSSINGSQKEVGMDSVRLVYEADGDVIASGAGNMFRDDMNQVKGKKNISSANSSNLIRQSSSPAGFFSDLADEIGKS